VVGYVINDGSAKTNAGPILTAPRNGNLTHCFTVVKVSDAGVAFSFQIKLNGTSVFSSAPSLAAGAAAGSTASFALTSTPLAVATHDLFTLDILTGSATWQLTAQLD